MLENDERTAIVRLLRGWEVKTAPSIDFCRPFGICTVFAAALVMVPAPVSAAARVSGSAEAVTVEAQDSSIQEILALLNRDFNLQYRVPVDLSGRVSGTYKGSLAQVVRRLLDGRNFVVESNPGGLAVTVFGVNGAAARPNTVVNGPVPRPTAQNPAVWSRPPALSNGASPVSPPSTSTNNGIVRREKTGADRAPHKFRGGPHLKDKLAAILVAFA